MHASPRDNPAKRKSAGPVPRAEELGFRPLFGVETYWPSPTATFFATRCPRSRVMCGATTPQGHETASERLRVPWPRPNP